jgi:hypothetical protein
MQRVNAGCKLPQSAFSAPGALCGNNISFSISAMAFLSDLDTFAWVVTIGALVICGAILILDLTAIREKLPIRSRAQKKLLWILAVVSVGGLYGALANPSDSKHEYVVGPIKKIEQLRLRGADDGMLGCIDPCTNNSLPLRFDRDAEYQVSTYDQETKFVVGYLDDLEELSLQISAHKVVDIKLLDTQKSIYHFDTRVHPYRTAVLLFDTLLFFFTGILCDRLSDKSPDTEDSYENYHDSRDGHDGKSDLTSINLSPGDDRSGETNDS